MRIGLAFRVFFRTLFDRDFSDRMAALLMGSDIQQAAKPEPKAVSPPVTPPPQRSEAVTLLAALQREARFVDLVQDHVGHGWALPVIKRGP